VDITQVATDVSARMAEADLSEPRKLEALQQAVNIATGVAYNATKGEADGRFLELLVQLVTVLLPILLEMLESGNES